MLVQMMIIVVVLEIWHRRGIVCINKFTLLRKILESNGWSVTSVLSPQRCTGAELWSLEAESFIGFRR